MGTVLPYIAIGIGLLVLGALVSLLALLPPIRRWCRSNPPARIATMCVLGLASFAPTFMLWTRLVAEANYVFGTLITVDTYGQPFVTQPAEMAENGASVIRELWQRRLAPPPLRRACYAGEETICRLADAVAAYMPEAWTGIAYLEEVGTAMVSALSTVLLAWLWTRGGGQRL